MTLRKAGRFSALALVVTMLAGCATLQVPPDTEPKSVPAAEALALLPPGSLAMLGVVQTEYVNAVEQRIALETRSRSPGENYIHIQSFTEEAHSATPGGLQDVPLFNVDMAGEARGTVSFADMKLSEYFVQNYYGPFGYSMGRTAEGETCMYAWQRIAPDRPFAGTSVQRGAITIKMLVCDSDYSEQELLSLMLDLRVKGATGLPVPVNRGVGMPVRMAPVGALGVGNVLAEEAPAPIIVSSPSPAPANPAPLEDPIPAPGSPTVPPPGTPSRPGGAVPDVPTTPAPVVPSPIRYVPLFEGTSDLFLAGFQI